MDKNRESLFLAKLEQWKIHQKRKEKKSKISDFSYTTNQYTTFWSEEKSENRIGIYITEGCDLAGIFASVPLVQPILKGRCCIFQEAKMGAFRSDMILHNYLNDYSPEIFQPITKKMAVPADCFKIDLFEKKFSVEGINGLEEFPKTVIIMTIGRDYNRSMYQHKQHGFLFDPGIWWLNQSMDKVLDNLSTGKWFRENFTNLGQMTVEYFSENFGRLIKLLQEKTNAYIVVFNLLTLEPGDLTHNYQFIKKSPKIRRMEFNLALVELSQKLNFSIMDMDRILKKIGLSEMPDFVHYPDEVYPIIGQEFFKILLDAQIISK